MTLYNEWVPAEATMEIMGELHTFHAPSKVALIGGIAHLADSAAVFIKNCCVYKPINYIVDVGANIGATALLFHLAFPEARILAIEPVKDNYDYLTRNTTDFSQIAPLKMAAHDKKCEVRVSMPTQEQRPDVEQDFGNSGLFSVYGQDTEHSETVAADMLDNIVDGAVDFLKIDVEGAELLVLAGAERIVSKDRPIMLMELRPANLKMAGNTGDDVSGLFKKIGYKIVGQYLSDVVLFPIEMESLSNEDK